MSITVRVKPTMGEMFELDTNPEETINEFKQKVAAIKNVQVNDVRMAIGGRYLKDKRKMESYQITDGTILDMIIVLRGD